MTVGKQTSLVRQIILLCCVAATGLDVCHGREWTDASDQYSWQAELFAASKQIAVLRDRKGELQAVQVSELSQADKQFVEAYLREESSSVSKGIHTWTMKSGLKVKGTVLGYKSGPVEIENRSGVAYVNRKRFRGIDPVYQAMVVKLVAASEDDSVKSVDDFKAWVRTLRREKRMIQVDGVLMKLKGGDEYAVPLFLFSPPDRKMLETGWQQWSAEEATKQQKAQEDTLLRAEAQEYQEIQRRKEATDQENRRIQMMQLGLLAVDAGVTSLWEVQMAPGRGVYGRPMKVVVPANDSQAAQRAAMQKHPGYLVGPVRQISRR